MGLITHMYTSHNVSNCGITLTIRHNERYLSSICVEENKIQLFLLKAIKNMWYRLDFQLMLHKFLVIVWNLQRLWKVVVVEFLDCIRIVWYWLQSCRHNVKILCYLGPSFIHSRLKVWYRLDFQLILHKFLVIVWNSQRLWKVIVLEFWTI